jgi:nucleotide-binding universal stress UspA family protein
MQQDRGSVPVAVLVEEAGASRSAVEWAAREAGILGRRLVLVHLTTVPHPTLKSAWDSAPSVPTCACMLADAAQVARRVDPQVRLEREVLDGPPGRVLLERTAAYRLLAVPQHGRRSFAGIPVGSWAPWLAAHAWCPVVLVPDIEREFPDDDWIATGFDDALNAGLNAGDAYVADADDGGEGAEYERPLTCAHQGSWT